MMFSSNAKLKMPWWRPSRRYPLVKIGLKDAPVEVEVK